VTSKSCEPNNLSVPAGDRTFEIANRSDRAVEWEILDGVMVIAERENIAPGFRQTLKVRLAPGDYEVTCGLLSNPRGTLHVEPSQEANAAPAHATVRSFLGPLSEYKFYLGRQSGAAVRTAKDLANAIHAGALAKAQALYVEARQPYKRIEPVVYRFSDLQNTIDPVADFFEKREADPAFLGYRRIERGLFVSKSLDGLPPVADRLVADLTKLDERLKAMKMTPDVLIASAGNFATHLSRDRLPAGEAQNASGDMSDIKANLEGLGKIVRLLRPVVKPVDPALAQRIDETFSASEDAVSEHNIADPLPEGSVDPGQRKELVAAFTNLAEALNQLPSAIGTISHGT
jgi:iron uptake system EfeUOB component EfeO/EfeM